MTSLPRLDDATVERIRTFFERTPRAMTMMAARQLGVPEAELLRYHPQSTELHFEQLQPLLEALSDAGEVHVIISNGSTTLESVGTFGGFSRTGDFLNVQSGSLDMHIRSSRIASAFLLRKPSHFDGVETLSVQFYDIDGASAFKVFLNFGVEAPSTEAEALSKRLLDRWT